MHIPGIHPDADHKTVLRRLAASHGRGYRYVYTTFEMGLEAEIGPRVGFNRTPENEFFFTSAFGTDPE